MTLSAIKQSIWSHRKINRSEVNLHVEAAKHKIPLPISDPEVAQRFLDHLNKRKIKHKVDVSKDVIDRYNQAHESYFKTEYPNAHKDGFYIPPSFPDIGTTNGITRYVTDFIKWSGGYANRLNVQGRQIGGITKEASGAKFDDRKFITSSTRKGTEDLDCVWQGKKIAIEIKNAVTRDRISPDQEKQKARIERAGGIYWVVTSVENFLQQWDKILYLKIDSFT